MEKKNKIIIITVAILIVLVVMITLGITIGLSNKSKQTENFSKKTVKLYDTLNNKNVYSFEITLDKNNKMYYAKKNNMAYINNIYDGNESKFIVKNGNSYLLNDSNKVYYIYENNETELEKIEKQIEYIKDLEYTQGSEKIEKKEYKYEEYSVSTDFLYKGFEDDEIENVKTRFYYDEDELVYIKTIVGDYQELITVEISYEVDEDLFNIPSDYKEA